MNEDVQEQEQSGDPMLYVMGSGEAEYNRLRRQGEAVTHAMGGLFPDTLSMDIVESVLDVACGPGDWAIEVAHLLMRSQITACDYVERYLTYAGARAYVQGIRNISFDRFDIRSHFKYADNSFDIVNARFLVGILPRDRWAAFLKEVYRIVKPGGVVILTECDDMGITSSSAFTELSAISSRYSYDLGLYIGAPGGIRPRLRPFLEQAGFESIVQQPCLLDFSVDQPYYEAMFENIQAAIQIFSDQAHLGAAIKSRIHTLYQQCLLDFRQPDFLGQWLLLTAYGFKPDM